MQRQLRESPAPRSPESWRNRAALALLVLGCLATLLGVWRHELLAIFPYQHLQVQLALAAGAAVLGGVLAMISSFSLAAAIGLVWLLLLLIFVDPLALLASGLLVLAAWSLGRRLFAGQSKDSLGSISIVLGLALIAGTLGWVLAYPVHTRFVYLAGLLVLVSLSISHLRWRSLQELSARCISAARAPRPPVAVLAVMCLGLLSTSLWLPNLMFDDLAYHLGMASQLERWQYYRMDAGSQVWAVSPWAGSVLHSIVWVVAGEGARSALNAVWLMLTVGLIWRVGHQLGLTVNLVWWLLALFASLPLTYMLLAGLQSETATITVALALVSLVLQKSEAPDLRLLLACAVLLGFLLALKASNILLVGPIGLWMLLRWYPTMRWRWVLSCAVVAFLVALSSYFHAWLLTGNPVLPLYNDLFDSPFYPSARFFDSRWHAGLEWALPWRMAFSTQRYFEGWAGAGGFLWVALIGLVPLGLLDRNSRPLLLVGLFAIVLPLLLIQYLRYAHPGLVLALPALLLVLRSVPTRILGGLLGMMVVTNLAFQGNAHWTFHDAGLQTLLLQGRSVLERRVAPELSMARWVQARGLADARILLADPNRPFHARFAGQAFTRAWYDPGLFKLAKAADHEPDGVFWVDLWEFHGITHVLTVGEPTAAVANALETAESIHSVGDATLWALNTIPERDLMQERDLARQLWPRGLMAP